MPWPLPSPDDLRSQAEADLEEALRDARDENGEPLPPAVIAASVRASGTIFNVLCRVYAMSLFSAHLHQRWWADQYFPDTAESENLARHADIWNIPRAPAATALGSITLFGEPGTAVPAELELRAASGLLYVTTAGGVIDSEGECAVPVRALAAGPTSNVTGGGQLSLVSPVPGVEPFVRIGEAGIDGGSEEESDESVLTRLLARIRQPPHGGANHDYVAWARQMADVDKVAVYGQWVGKGSVGVIVSMRAGREPTTDELAALHAIIMAVRPVTVTQVIVLPRVAKVIPLRLRATPDTAAVRAAMEAAAAIFFDSEAEIGGAIHHSRLSEALSAASGEYSHRLIEPALDIFCERTELPMLGPITWESGA